MAWECADCGKRHRSNPTRCKSCGCTLLNYTEGVGALSYAKWIFLGLLAAIVLLVGVVQLGLVP